MLRAAASSFLSACRPGDSGGCGAGMSSEEQQVCRVALLASLDPTGQFKRVSAATSLLVDDDKCSLHPVLLEADEAGL